MKRGKKIQALLFNQLAGVTIYFTPANQMELSFLVLKRRKKKLEIVKKVEGLDSFKELTKKIGKLPVWLTFSGRPVFSKRLEQDPENNYLHRILPNAHEEDFKLDTCKQASGAVLLSVIRADVIDPVLQQLNEMGIPVLGYSLGPNPVQLLLDANLVEDNRIHIPGSILEIRNNEIISTNPEDESVRHSYSIDKDLLECQYIPSFAGALGFMLNRESIDTTPGNVIQSGIEGFIYRQLFRIVGLGAVAFLFLALLVNFFLFSNVNGKLQLMEAEGNYQRKYVVKQDSLKQEVSLKTGVVLQMGLAENTKYSFYLDRMISVMPNGITLNKLQCSPLNDKINEKKPLVFERQILMEGASQGSLTLNEWINKLKDLDWIRDIEVVWYRKKDELGEFQLNVFVK
ncbi:MAG: hypothetical protein JW801_19450 [Bacteroidales bacterium]|nr:hypothetical protein [Bacteroidales bacterium]